MKIRCRTLFDITATGVTGHYKPSRIPFQDRSGKEITNESTWHLSRNQQRNWETITQLLQLRTQINDVSDPEINDGIWQFEFGTDIHQVFGDSNDSLGLLKNDCEGVPMLTGLNEKSRFSVTLIANGSDQNIWFDVIE
jgi:hypothetical protein|tara:strand:+ start:946 stop:1359 length:414 start_codon:yes stop_codon:yes gene_type:complete